MEKREEYAQRLMEAFHRMARYRHAAFLAYFSDFGVTVQQFHLLMHIRSSGKLKVSDLSGCMLVAVPTVSRMINTLCETGLVIKNKDKGDRRSTYLELTPEGERVAAEMQERQLEITSHLMGKIPADDLEVFLEVTEMIADGWLSLLEKVPAKGEGTPGGSS